MKIFSYMMILVVLLSLIMVGCSKTPSEPVVIEKEDIPKYMDPEEKLEEQEPIEPEPPVVPPEPQEEPEEQEPVEPEVTVVPPEPQEPVVKEINIEMFKWGFNQDEVEINKGDTVRMILTSSDGTHGFSLPDFGVFSGRVSSGEEEILEFTADKSGTFTFFCNVYCGQGHSSMKGSITVN